VNEQKLFSKLESKIKKQINQHEKELNAIIQNINSIEKQKTKLIQLLASEIITQQEYMEVVQQNEANLKSLQHTKTEIDKKLSNIVNPKHIERLRSELEQFRKVDVLTPELLHRLIEKIEIKADGTARIFYRFSLPSAIIYSNFSNTQHSTCVVCGNISTGWTSTVL
jgi:hypothetical protein